MSEQFVIEIKLKGNVSKINFFPFRISVLNFLQKPTKQCDIKQTNSII